MIKYKADQPITDALIQAAGNSPVLARLLAQRGITTVEAAQAFLQMDQYEPSDCSVFEGWETALERVCQAIDKQEPILIYGDFDVDGITGTAIFMEAFTLAGAKVSYYVPNRHTEGHGLNTTALCRLVSSRGIKLVITTDTGSSNFNEVTLLKGLGVDTIITDHHEVPEHLPPALAVLNPKLLSPDSPMAQLCGAGMAYKFCQALLDILGLSQSAADALLDLTAIGTVVDMVPLLQENRYLVWRGLVVLNRRERVGLQAILDAAGTQPTSIITSQTLGFVLGPRLNAIGRLGDATEAVELLITRDKERAHLLAAKLEQCNRQRQEMVEKALVQAETHLINTGDLHDHKAIILCSEEWNPGIVGLVASRLIEKFYRPCFIGFVDNEHDEIRFSARSIPGFNLHEALTTIEDLFIKWGGHQGAAGFSIKKHNLKLVKQKIQELCHQRITDDQLVPVTEVDMSLEPSQINPYLVELIDKMAPFGQENPLPIFAMEGVAIRNVRMMGADERHLQLMLQGAEPGRYLKAIYWNWEGSPPQAEWDYRLTFTLQLNTYNGATTVQLMLRDVLDTSQTHRQVIMVEPTVKSVVPASKPKLVIDWAEGGPQWVDHRGRADHQLLLTQARDESDYAVYCEGTQHYLPVELDPGRLLTRHDQGPPCHHLVLWDLPPSMESLLTLIQSRQAAVVHLVGGKYEKIPLYRPPQIYLEGLAKLLHRLTHKQPDGTVELDIAQLAVWLTTTPQVVLAGISMLSRLQYLEARIVSKTNRVQARLNPGAVLAPDQLLHCVEYLSFQAVLGEVHNFREWLMKSPTSVIQPVIALELKAGSRLYREQHHAIHIR